MSILKRMQKRLRTPPFPHHKYMIYMVSGFFRAQGLVRKLTLDRFMALEQILVGRRKGCSIPRCLLLDPTNACNLHCTGCWAAGYDTRDSLSYEQMDDLLTQAEQLHIHYCFLSGGEPLVRKEDILRLCRTHRKISFSAFTNGTLIDEAFVRHIKEVQNFTVYLSLEGFREQTNLRRGAGVYDRVMWAMELLREQDIEFGFSVCYHSGNYQEIASDEFLDLLRTKGCKMGWLFTYIPVGRDADLSLVCSPEQRAYVYRKIEDYTQRHDIAIIDFWNNGHLAAGCVAASHGFVHINSRGDFEPCAFSHYSDSNIHTKTLEQALKSPFFNAYRMAQPYSPNPLRSCPLIDMPDKLIDVVEKSGARSTEYRSPETVREFVDKTRPIAAAWAPVADELYRQLPRKSVKTWQSAVKLIEYKKRRNLSK